MLSVWLERCVEHEVCGRGPAFGRQAMTELLTSGETRTVVVQGVGSAFMWSWYELRLEDNNTYHNAVVTVDSETLQQSAGEQVWVRFDVIMLNGTLPGDPVNQIEGPVIFGEPECWQGEECQCCSYVLEYQDMARITASYGFNESAPGGLHYPPLDRILIGVRPSPATQQLGVTTTSFTISATALPRVVPDGTIVESSLAPCTGLDIGGRETCRQYFTVPVRGYDILHVRLERTGDNITNYDGSSNGGRGLVGSMCAIPMPCRLPTPRHFPTPRVGSRLPEPARLRRPTAETTALLRRSGTCRLGRRSSRRRLSPSISSATSRTRRPMSRSNTSAPSRRRRASTRSPWSRATTCRAASAPSFSPRMRSASLMWAYRGRGVGGTGCTCVTRRLRTVSLLPPGASLSALLLLPSGATASPPRPRPPNRIPRHQSRVGEIAGLGDLRPGCVAFGQTRNYSLTTSGSGDANLFVEVTEGNISSMRARCEGCEWVGWTVGCVPDAKPGSCCDHYSQYYNCGGSGDDNGGTAQLSRAALGMSPCTMRNGTTWQVQVSLADATTATLDGLTPTEFTLRAELQNATMYDGREVRSRSDGGSGYVCCGAVRSFLMPEVPETHALAIQLNLTRGVVRVSPFQPKAHGAPPSQPAVQAIPSSHAPSRRAGACCFPQTRQLRGTARRHRG